MKYFTYEWWSSAAPQEEKVGVFEEYRTYFSSVSERLPQELVKFESEHTLHDAQVKKVFCLFHKKEVIVKLLGWDCSLECRIYFSLRFIDVVEFNQILPQQEYVESEFGDLGYWEVESIDSGAEIRMIFASGAEFMVVFKEFSFSVKNMGT